MGFLREDGKKALRVSSPEGMQRSTYFLSLPLKYSIVLMVASIMLHWLISQSVFLVQSCAFGPGTDGERLPALDQSSRGYSILGSTLALSLAGAMVVALSLNSVLRSYHDIPPGFQLMAFNSSALKAVCQRPEGDTDARYFPVRIGAVSDMEDVTAGYTPRLVFSTDTELRTPEHGGQYLQPVFVEREGNWRKLNAAASGSMARCCSFAAELWNSLLLFSARRRRGSYCDGSDGRSGLVDEWEMEPPGTYRHSSRPSSDSESREG